MLPTITHLERIQTRGSKTKVWETSKATLLFGMSWCWVFSSYLIQIYFPSFILILVLGAWSVGTTSTCSIYFHILLCSAEGIPCRSDHYCLGAASLILSSIHSFILPFILPSSVCLCLSTPHSTPPPVSRFQWQLPPRSHSGHSGVTSWYSLPRFTALSLLISIPTYKVLSLRYLQII